MRADSKILSRTLPNVRASIPSHQQQLPLGSLNSKVDMETAPLLSRHIPICLPNERASPTSFLELRGQPAPEGGHMHRA